MKLDISTANANPTAAIVAIGNELLSGRTLDTNSNYLAKSLTEMGIKVETIRAIPDKSDVIINTVNELRDQVSYVFCTGGIGPTHDDITAENIAKAVGVSISLNDEALKRLENHYGEEHLNDARKKMAFIPEGASLIDNPVSAAPGFYIENVYVMAGIPKIMEAMFAFLKPLLSMGKPFLTKNIEVSVTEGNLAKGLGEIQSRYPEVDIGSYPYIKSGHLGTVLVLRSFDEDKLNQVYDELNAYLETLPK